MRFDSCRQCIRRRIKCDAGEPECQKCKKKGITCSGAGKSYRFVQHTENFGKKKHITQIPLSTHNLENQTATNDLEHDILLKDRAILISYGKFDCLNKDVNQNCPYLGSDSAPLPAVAAVHEGYESSVQRRGMTVVKASHLEFLDPNLRMLFDHFSSAIAPAMVVIDRNANGYRNILLPLATQDPLVQRAVAVVAALHLGRKRCDLLQAAEKSRSAIIECLRKDALHGHHDRVFSISTWATIVLLLVGETVTGDQAFVHLFPMLNSFLECSGDLVQSCPDAAQFLRQQSQMFNLFTPPFLNPTIGVAALRQQLEQYFDFLSYSATEETDIFVALETIKDSIYLARNLYLREVQCELSTSNRWQAVEEIRQTVLPITVDTPGMHALVWTYFIAGAASSDQLHRDFFLKRLKQVYEKTHMRNVVTAIHLLQQSVWRLTDGHNWASSQAILNRVLIM